MLPLFAIAGCQKEETTSTEGITADSALLVKGENPPAAHEPRCQCEYQIVSVSVTNSPPIHPANFTQFACDVLTVEQCISTTTCKYFKGIDGCDYDLGDPCANHFPPGTPHPTPWTPFNCMVVYDSDFTVTVSNAYWWNPTCDIPSQGFEVPQPQGEAIARVRCRKTEGVSDECGSAWYESALIPLPFMNGTFQSNLTPGVIKLEGCGCTPVYFPTW